MLLLRFEVLTGKDSYLVKLNLWLFNIQNSLPQRYDQLSQNLDLSQQKHLLNTIYCL